MNNDSHTDAAVWEPTYRNAGRDRLWPPDPTIDALDLSAVAGTVQTVLDAGCGDGKNLAWLVRQGYFVFGADASASAIGKCRRYLEGQDLWGRHLLLAPTALEALPLTDASVDAVICVDVLGHQHQPEPVLRELTRVLRPGGFAYASLFHVDDACRTGPRMRPGPARGEYWYRASGPLDREYYFHFYDEADACALFDLPGLRLESLSSRRWQEPPHVGYRDEWHEHQSWFALLRKDDS